GLLAVAMSTGDSFLNAGGILLTHDVVKPMYDKRKKVINELKLTKYLTLLMGIVSIFIGLLSQDIIKVNFWASSLFGSTITIPFLAGVLGLKTDAKSFFTAFWVAFITFVVANMYLESEKTYLAPLFSIIANGVSFFGMHFVQYSGLVIVRRKGSLAIDEKVTWESIVTGFKSCLPTRRSITSFSKRQVERYGANHLLFGVFFSLNYIVPYFMWTPEKSPYFTTIMSLRAIGGMLCVGLLTEDHWPKWAKRFFPTYWHISVLYCLPFVSTFMLFLLGGAESMEWVINLSLAIVVTASLVDWVSFTVLMVLGVAGGYGFFTLFSHKYLGGIAPLANMPGIYIQILIYSSLFATLLGLVFFRKKEKKTRSQLKSMENFAGAIVHEVSNVVGLSQMYASALQNFMTEIKEKTTKKGKKLYILDENTHNGIKEIVETLERDCKKGLTIMRRMIVTLEPEIKPEDTDVYSIGRCVKEAIEGYDMEDFQEERVHIDIREDFKFRGSKYYL
ncbi:MAG: hypothetical protein MI674_03330, partial [Cytophagales bacterium]|nr:hypothetical protein [Cytophagales bacterium]